MINCLSEEAEAGRVVVIVAMIVLLSCVSVCWPSMVILHPHGVVAGRLVRDCAVCLLHPAPPCTWSCAHYAPQPGSPTSRQGCIRRCMFRGAVPPRHGH